IHARATDNHGNITISAPVVVAVGSNTAPEVAIISPIHGSEVLVNSATTVRATASDPDGLISSVAFRVNGLALGEPVVAEPFEVIWTPLVSGSYTFTAIATDSSGNSTESAPVKVMVIASDGTPPVVTLDAPETAYRND